MLTEEEVLNARKVLLQWQYEQLPIKIVQIQTELDAIQAAKVQ